MTTRAFHEASMPLFAADEAVVMPQAKSAQPSYIRDHRARLRDRFLSGGAGAMPDYEVLELVLFRAIPRRDVKPLARHLIETFDNFNGVISAPPERLAEVDGVGPAVITELKIVEAAAHRLARAKVLDRPVISSSNAEMYASVEGRVMSPEKTTAPSAGMRGAGTAAGRRVACCRARMSRSRSSRRWWARFCRSIIARITPTGNSARPTNSQAITPSPVITGPLRLYVKRVIRRRCGAYAQAGHADLRKWVARPGLTRTLQLREP